MAGLETGFRPVWERYAAAPVNPYPADVFARGGLFLPPQQAATPAIPITTPRLRSPPEAGREPVLIEQQTRITRRFQSCEHS